MIQLLNVQSLDKGSPIIRASVKQEIEKIEKPINDVTFFDHEGTVLYSYDKESFLKLTEMPPLPSLPGLICQEWNWDFEDAQEYVRNYGILVIGATYITDDDRTRLYIKIPINLDIPLYTPSTNMNIDWGDGSPIEVVTAGTTYHTYKPGNYILSLGSIDGQNYSVAGRSNGNIFGNIPEKSDILKSIIYKVELGNNISYLGTNAFCYCHNLKSISIPNNIKSISTSTTYGQTAIYGHVPCIVIPNNNFSIGKNSITSFNNISFSKNSYFSKSNSTYYQYFPGDTAGGYICLPPTITQIDLLSIPLATKIIIPEGVALIGYYGIGTLAAKQVKMPSTITKIESYGIQARYLSLLDFSQVKQVPTMASSSSIQNIKNENLKILIPLQLYDNFLTDTNWSNFADYFKTDYDIVKYNSLSITAEDVPGDYTKTWLDWTAFVDVKHSITDEFVSNKIIKGRVLSEEFDMNTSTEESTQREISFTYGDLTATTTITQDAYKEKGFTIDLNNQWQQCTQDNPLDELKYLNLESFSNYGSLSSNKGKSIMYINIEGLTKFEMYIRISAVNSSLYQVMVSHLDKIIDDTTSYTDTDIIKTYVWKNNSVDNSLDNYTKIVYDNIDGGSHTISIAYNKSDSALSGNDRGYILIPNDQYKQ